jgi:heptosyltransferase-2
MKACVFLPNWVGDLTMATPTLRALRRRLGGEARIVGIMKPYLSDVLAGTSWLNEVWFYDRQGRRPALRPAALARKLRAARFDVCLLLTNDFLSAFLAWVGGAARRVGYVRYRRGPLLNLKLHPRRAGGRIVPSSTLDYYLELAYALGCPEEMPRMEVVATPDDERRADAAWERLGLRPGPEVVVLNSSGAYGGAKLWPEEYFVELARRIAEGPRLDVLILCGPAERERALRIVRRADHPRVRSLAGEDLSLGLSKAVLKRSRLLVSTDSGPRHFAAAFGRPVVTLFGPTHQAWSDTRAPGDSALQVPVECGPCQERECPLGHHRCMRELSVDMVWAEVRRRLEEEG